MVADETGDEAERNARERSDYADERAFDDKDEHDAARARTHRAQDGYVRATLNDDEHECRRDVERGDNNDESDDEKPHAAFEGERGKERAIRFLPGDGCVFAAELLAQAHGYLLDRVDVFHFDAD